MPCNSSNISIRAGGKRGHDPTADGILLLYVAEGVSVQDDQPP